MPAIREVVQNQPSITPYVRLLRHVYAQSAEKGRYSVISKHARQILPKPW